ncbi:MAG: SH3 domain-containing protein [Bacteroidota bacterium]|jgi:hypothetical protein
MRPASKHLFSIILTFLGVISLSNSNKIPFHSPGTCCGKCVGSASCNACKTCEYCHYCNSGGTCGVCNSNPSSTHQPQYSKEYTNRYNFTENNKQPPFIGNQTHFIQLPASAIVNAKNLNVRAGPGINFEIINKLSTGDNVTVTEFLSKSWVKIEWEDIEKNIDYEGYVSINYLSFYE